MSAYTDNINNVIQARQTDIAKHMRRWGVHHPGHQWTHRDLYNGYRVFGSPFLNGLGTVLSSLFAGRNAPSAQTNPAWQQPVTRSPQISLPQGTQDIDEAPALTSELPGTGSYTGNEYSNATGHDIRKEDHHRNEWFNRALRGVVLPFPGYFETPWIGLGDGMSPGGQELPPGEDYHTEETIFGIERKKFFVLAIVLVLGFLYFKYRK